MKFQILLFVLLFSTISLYGQTYEYLGLLKLPDSSLIPYKLDFKEIDGKIYGYSYTDLNGQHETKSKVVGRYDKKEKLLEFREVELVYTKSSMAETTFCNVYFNGNMRRLNGKSKIEGKFKGYYDDLTSCINGELFMSAAEKIQKRNEKFQRKIDRTKRVPDSIKEKINLDKMFNRYSKNDLKGGEQLNILWKEEYLKLIIWDVGLVDGDQIDLTVNGTKVLNSYSPVSEKKEMILTLKDSVNIISLKAIDVGTRPPNTTKIQFRNKSGETIDLVANLQLNEIVTFAFHKDKPKVKKP